MSLDGTPEEILLNYLQVMAHIRFWFVSRGFEIDLSPILGYKKVVYIVPDEGCFHLVIKHQEM